MLAILKKELNSYFNSMIAYIFIGMFFLLSALYFFRYNLLYFYPDFTVVLSNMIIAFFILVPAITMRLISEETNKKTDQLLLTSPLKVSQIVIGKYLAALLLFFTTLLVTCIFPIILSFFGNIPIEKTLGTYTGFFLLGMSFISVGIFISALSHNQITAAVVTFAVLFLLFVMGSLISGLPTDRNTSIGFVAVLVLIFAVILYFNMKNIIISILICIIGAIVITALYFYNNAIFDGAMVNILKWFSVTTRFSNFSNGIFSLSDCIYYLSFSLAFVYLTIGVIEKRKWS